MSGRGRGISNKPAWMTRAEGPGGDNGGGGGAPPMGDRYDDRGPPPRDRGPPPRRGYDGPPRGGGGGGFDRGGGGGGFDRGGRYDDFRDRGPPRGGDYRGERRDFHNDRRGPPPPRRGGGDFDHRRDNNNRRGGPIPNHKNPGTIFFRSFEEEQHWVEERRRKRLARKSKFDITPTPEQAAADAAMVALSNPAATDFAGINANDRNFSAVPQQTRHARRLYIGQLPPNVTEQELHVFFRDAIDRAILPNSPGTVNGQMQEDPILSVYINHERKFSFLEFKSVEMTTACMELDGIDINGKGKVKVKRPNDYNPTMAPKANLAATPQLDISRLGIISGTVPDGPDKIFVGGLHYHLSADQVLELLQAFGKVKAFHLVKNDPDSETSKGYCFVEYIDPAATNLAVQGLNGMDLGGGKMLTARVAGERGGQAPSMLSPQADVMDAAVSPAASGGNLPPNANIVHGYDIELLVDAAMGKRPMPTAPMYLDSFGMPLTRLAPTPFAAAPAPQPPSTPQERKPSALDIANAALAAISGTPGAPSPGQAPPPPVSRILVLSNMVTEEDLASDDDYNGLCDEVREECMKFGRLHGMQIPRRADGTVQPSAILKIFLEYASVRDAQAAENELKGRKFGNNVVQTSFFSESEYAAGRLN
ncbi:Splicing factor U2af large subunit [Seminavis robusta]|uniref:Splicing factor U2af large subunit n=1 Tax=Seminavis robusta TaxID=568900 RepID=A0A9N8H0M2_9STRA|nr:Splicing factor U2af large subunit [Seminavis robusta]|eukprot:Sro4_g003060.1 Splicing factor U2af large subunit (648) ;mRNA; f:34259-36389